MTQSLRLVFAGTPEFAVPHLHACRMPGVEIVAVYTQPDRAAGRGRSLHASPVKHAALTAGLRVEQPGSLKDAQVQARLRALAPDLCVVVAYGMILPRRVLAIPRLGCWNVHASLLPRWRGAAPIAHAILAGDTRSGVCLMQMDAGLDTGPVLLQRSVDIAPRETAGSLHDTLAALGAHLLAEGVQRIVAGRSLPAHAQSAEGATYAHKLDKSHARLDWQRDVQVLDRQVRAYDPWPVAEADLQGDRVRVWRAQPGPATGVTHAAGSIVAASRDGIDVACAGGTLRVLELQRAGGRRISAADYLNARPALRRAP